ESSGLTEAFKAYLNTRQAVIDAGSNDRKKAKGKSVFRKLAEAVREGMQLDKNIDYSPLDHVAVYNYFQRPSYKYASTIKVSEKDADIAYETLKEIVMTLNIQRIIFTSTKAYDTFKKKDDANKNPLQKNRKI